MVSTGYSDEGGYSGRIQWEGTVGMEWYSGKGGVTVVKEGTVGGYSGEGGYSG